MPIGGPMTTWCEPMQRGDMKLVPGDIQDALTWYKDTTGQDVKLIVLHPKNERYAKEVPEGIALEYVSGCLSWEVWLSPVDNFTRNKASEAFLGGEKTIQGINYPSSNLSTLTDKKIEVDKLKAVTHKVTRERPGPKLKALPVEKINQWAGEGMGSKAIAARLKGEGIEVSYKTIQRILKGERLLV